MKTIYQGSFTYSPYKRIALKLNIVKNRTVKTKICMNKQQITIHSFIFFQLFVLITQVSKKKKIMVRK